MTTRLTPQQFSAEWDAVLHERKAQGKDNTDFDNTLFFNVNINKDPCAARADAEQFLGMTSSEEYQRQILNGQVLYHHKWSNATYVEIRGTGVKQVAIHESIGI